MTLSAKSTEILAALRAHTEGCSITDDKGTWRQVYLDNARPAGMSPRAFAGHLSALADAGLYHPMGDDCFGEVLAETKP